MLYKTVIAIPSVITIVYALLAPIFLNWIILLEKTLLLVYDETLERMIILFIINYGIITSIALPAAAEEEEIVVVN